MFKGCQARHAWCRCSAKQVSSYLFGMLVSPVEHLFDNCKRKGEFGLSPFTDTLRIAIATRVYCHPLCIVA